MMIHVKHVNTHTMPGTVLRQTGSLRTEHNITDDKLQSVWGALGST